MSKEQQPDGGAIWNVRALVGDLADETPPSPASQTGREAGSPGPAAVHQAPADPGEPRTRGGWVSQGEVVRRTTGNSTRRMTLLAGIMLVGLLVLLVGAALVSTGEDEADRPFSPSVPAEPRSLPSPDEPDPTEPTSTTAEAGDPEEDALSSLRRLNLQDLSGISLDGTYAAQLASKTVGIVDVKQTAANGSHTFYATDILEEHLRLREKFDGDASVVLLLSTDYGRQQLYDGQPLWITFALLSAPSKEVVAQWCAGRFPDLTGSDLENRCVPRRLNPPGSP
ncbi:hypothetical protein AB0C02_13110 [Micromonospora sp. NPDC048999]|uniref:hypothetical protein n=1 Tax=Micromonospora sp. NPDC048999 TaxID=3155391 RepID=UPI0033D45795